MVEIVLDVISWFDLGLILVVCCFMFFKDFGVNNEGDIWVRFEFGDVIVFFVVCFVFWFCCSFFINGLFMGSFVFWVWWLFFGVGGFGVLRSLGVLLKMVFVGFEYRCWYLGVFEELVFGWIVCVFVCVGGMNFWLLCIFFLWFRNKI